MRLLRCAVAVWMAGLWGTIAVHAEQYPLKSTAPAGEHPRVLFTKAELPAIRARVQSPQGQLSLNRIKASVDAMAARMDKGGDVWRQSQIESVRRGLPLDGFQTFCRDAALLHQISGDAKYDAIARAFFQVFLDSQPADDQIKPEPSWGSPEYALAYDWAYDLLTDAERTRARKILGAMIGEPTHRQFDTEHFLNGPSASRRASGNWPQIFTSAIGLTAMALEGEVEVPAGLMDQTVDLFKAFLNAGITADGALFEGMSYTTGYGTDRLAQMVLALRLRGLDLTQNTHVLRATKWLTYEILPWGGEAQAMNKGNGSIGGGHFMTFLGQEAGPLGQWVYTNAAGHAPGPIQHSDLLVLINGIPTGLDAPPADLPVSHWFSVLGRVICRTGWGPMDAHLVFSTNPLYAGHTHADQGTFCLAADGVNFINDGEAGAYASEEHNIIHIDGLGQSQTEASTEAHIRSADFSAYADVMDADLKNAYERVLAFPGFSGPWHWTEFNPVQRADRRVMFVRGLTGPVLVTADDMTKDNVKHNYDWRIHTAHNNRIAVDGRRFEITERFGGQYLASLGTGQKAMLVRDKIDAGKYRGWLLVRGVPYHVVWSDTLLKVNGRTAYPAFGFALGNYSRGWYWVAISHAGPAKDPWMDLPAGPLKVEMTGTTGSEVSMAVFSRQYDWEPGFDLPMPDETRVILTTADAQQGEPAWDLKTDPQSELSGIFLGQTAPILEVATSATTQRPRLLAKVSDTSASYLCVMSPRRVGDDKRIVMPVEGQGSLAVIQSKAGYDLVAGVAGQATTSGPIVTDAASACVSMAQLGSPQTIKGYAVSAGRTLTAYGQVLLAGATQPVHAINDGQTLVLRGPGGQAVTLARLTAHTLRCNGQPSTLADDGKPVVTITIPELPRTWDVKISDDGTQVDVAGNGPVPMKILAPKAVNVAVSGINRWFIRDGDGNVYPETIEGTGLHQYRNRVSAQALSKLLAPNAKATLTTLPDAPTAALRIDGPTTLNIPNPGPAVYNYALTFWFPGKGTVTAETAGQKIVWETDTTSIFPERRGIQNIKTFTPVSTIQLNPSQPVYLLNVTLNPQAQLMPAEQWSLIGPFATPWDTDRQGKSSSVKAGLNTVYPPEKEQNFDARYPDRSGKMVGWQVGKTHGMQRLDLDKGVHFAAIGVDVNIGFDRRVGGICYAVTFIQSPDDRDAVLTMSCDWWANAMLNGQLVTSERNKPEMEQDGAAFTTAGQTNAILHLKKGWNTLLVKSHGGNGGNRFVAWITNPGDLVFKPKPQ
ncbi:MAG: heparinase II/III family protein [Phycisphaeraceae bacterium]|nr:heparinase II/III family protein [Phycisphaeraceae bacterium]